MTEGKARDMYGYVLQDWITIRGQTGLTSVTQTETDWLGLAPYQDVVFWIDVREVTFGGATNIGINLQTAPIKEDALFANMQTFGATTNGLTVIPNMSTNTATTVPLARWVRWQLKPNSTPTGTWDITFRILCAANAVSAT